MTSVLESVEWGKPVLELLGQTKQLDPKKPAIIHIRHSARQPVSLEHDSYRLSTTKIGEKAAYELGSKLPTTRKYHFYHTVIERTKETATNIHQGILDNGGKTVLEEALPITSLVDRESNTINMKNLIQEYKVESIAARTHFYRWLSGVYPPGVMKPSLLFAQQTASYMMKQFAEAEPEDVHLWVTHDTFVAAFLHHWLGESNFKWISFMDGFIMQFYDDFIMLFFRGHKKKVKYPYWWTFQSSF